MTDDLTKKLRECADAIDAAMPKGPWAAVQRNEDFAFIYAENTDEMPVGYALVGGGRVRAICTARNDAPALMREAAEEIARLRRDLKLEQLGARD